MGRSWLDVLDVWGERVLRGRFAQQFAALFYKNGELQLHVSAALERQTQHALHCDQPADFFACTTTGVCIATR
jgi:hypothetical protein